MSGFSADWLARREPVDAMARNVELTAELLTWRRGRETLTVLDLASGTGANFRFLAPVLGGEQHWRLVDHDPALLARGEELSGPWVAERGMNPMLDWRRLDLVHDWERLDCRGVHLVTASALLDLVSADWLEQLAQRCRDARAAVFMALSYDGSIVWEPALAGDESVRERVNRHQRTDKGFGPALGPDAAATLAILLRKVGYWVMLRPSPWVLEPKQAEMQRTLLEGCVEAARQIAPAEEDWVDWLAQRRHWIDRGESRLRVGHWDLFAWRDDHPADNW
ncbi:MAG: class I SAM-dependent methyltransferase [Candidatus Contendobacter sp.]|nr:class I SAM-dependent methyltransferase [Candidatus Contendobacter sp.]